MNNVYDKFKDYDKYFTGAMKETIFPPDILNKIAENVKGNVLDVGTANGYKLQNILEACDLTKVDKLVAIDPSPLYKVAAERLKGLEINKIDVLNCALNDFPENEKFDTILMLEIIEHIPNSSGALFKVAKLLKPNGIFICSTPNKFVFQITEKLMLKPPDKTHVNEMTYRRFISLVRTYFEEVGFRGVLPIMKIGRKYPKFSSLNKYFNYLTLSRTIYCFASKPRVNL